MALSKDEKQTLDNLGYIPMQPVTEEHVRYLLSDECPRSKQDKQFILKQYGTPKGMQFDINQLITPIVLEYLEPGWHDQTMQCLINSGFEQENILQVGREGVGSMSAAFNRVFEGYFGFDVVSTPYVWFVTNVEFDPDVPTKLHTFIAETGCAVVHPSFKSSHPWMWTTTPALGVPFVELTAPMFRLDALKDIGLMDEKMPYWGQDADWGHRARMKGWKIGVDPVKIEHTYLHQSAPHPISQIRKALRSLYDASTRARLVEKWGENWKELICKNGGC